MSLRDKLVEAGLVKTWRCFHCDGVFTTREEAALHFGTSEVQEPLCTVTAERYREVERRLDEFRNEADATSRTFFEMGSKAQQMATDAEQKGYDRGIADAKAHPGELGLVSLASIKATLEKRIQAIVEEHGDYEPDTNVTNLPDHAENDCSLIEDILSELVPKKET